MNKIRECWTEGARANFDEHRAMALAAFDHVERKAWVEFNETKNPRFLEEINLAIGARCRLLGLDAPSKVLTSKGEKIQPGKPQYKVYIPLQPLLTTEQRKRRIVDEKYGRMDHIAVLYMNGYTRDEVREKIKDVCLPEVDKDYSHNRLN